MQLKTRLLCIGIVFAFLLPSAPVRKARFLKVKKPVLNQGSDTNLLLSLDDIYNMIQLDELQDASGNIEIVNGKDETVIRLGKVKRGIIKWSFRVIDDKWLIANFDKGHYDRILELIEQGGFESGYFIELASTDLQLNQGKLLKEDPVAGDVRKGKNYLRYFPLTFSETPDLGIKMAYPIRIHSGQNLAPQVRLSVSNSGSAPAQAVQVDLLLTSSSALPPMPIKSSKTFSPDTPVHLGTIMVDRVNIGETREVVFTEPVIVPEMPPGKYYMAAVVDPMGTVKEFSEENNSTLSIAMLSFPKLKTLHSNLKGAVMTLQPADYGLSIEYQGAVISNGKDWRKCRMRPYIFQLRHANWKNYHWEVNTVDRGVWEVHGAEFCQTGGRGNELNLRVDVVGGSRFIAPSKVIIHLDDLELRFQGDAGRVELVTQKSRIEYGPAWSVCRMKSSVFRFRSFLWTDFFWEIDLFNKAGSRVTGVDFQREGGTRQPLDMVVTAEYAPETETKQQATDVPTGEPD